MANRPEHKMSIENRAKQFMPFAALKGFEEALAAKEKIIAPKMELSEDRMEELDRKMRSLKKGSIIRVTYFYKGEYLEKTGMAARIDAASRLLQVVDTKIPFEHIAEITILSG